MSTVDLTLTLPKELLADLWVEAEKHRVGIRELAVSKLLRNLELQFSPVPSPSPRGGARRRVLPGTVMGKFKILRIPPGPVVGAYKVGVLCLGCHTTTEVWSTCLSRNKHGCRSCGRKALEAPGEEPCVCCGRTRLESRGLGKWGQGPRGPECPACTRRAARNGRKPDGLPRSRLPMRVGAKNHPIKVTCAVEGCNCTDRALEVR